MKKKLGSQRCTASFSINKKPFSRIFPSYYFFPVLFHPHTEVTALPVCRHASLQPRPSPSDTRTTVTQVCTGEHVRSSPSSGWSSVPKEASSACLVVTNHSNICVKVPALSLQAELSLPCGTAGFRGTAEPGRAAGRSPLPSAP